MSRPPTKKAAPKKAPTSEEVKRALGRAALNLHELYRLQSTYGLGHYIVGAFGQEPAYEAGSFATPLQAALAALVVVAQTGDAAAVHLAGREVFTVSLSGEVAASVPPPKHADDPPRVEVFEDGRAALRDGVLDNPYPQDDPLGRFYLWNAGREFEYLIQHSEAAKWRP